VRGEEAPKCSAPCGSVGSSSKLGYFPDKSIEKAAGRIFSRMPAASLMNSIIEAHRRTRKRRRLCQRRPSLREYPRCAT
jgi:hypothetical protein